jgi:hypothetical protein
MSTWNAGYNWEYSRWLKNYARNCRITEPTNVLPYAGEKAGIITFLKYIWNPVTQTGTRPWLQEAFQRKATATPGNTTYQCNLDLETASVLVELLEVVGRDLKKLPVTAGEVAQTNTLFSGAAARVFGTTPTFGNVGGSVS